MATEIMQLPGEAAAEENRRRIGAKRLPRDATMANIKRRYRREAIFKGVGLTAIVMALSMLAFLLYTIVGGALPAFQQTKIALEIQFDEKVIDPKGERDPDVIRKANFQKLVSTALYTQFPDVTNRREKRALRGLISKGAALQLRDMVMGNPALISESRTVILAASDDIDQLNKGRIDRSLPEDDRIVKDNQLAWFDVFDDKEAVQKDFNWALFTAGDSREPELAGIFGALMGSFYLMLITLAISCPIGVMSAIYLEEFAPKNNRWVDIIEVNISNLAAVPSIVFGLLGLAVFLNVFHLPRSAPLVGGLTLSLMTLPTIVVATRAALRSVPPSIREAALGIGASKIQTISHHVLPLALPGILTGTIIGMAQALGETAPLLMIGMVAFIADIPSGPMDPATALPVQIFLWADSPERAFVERTSAAILVLLTFLISMNGIAVILRKRLERKW